MLKLEMRDEERVEVRLSGDHGVILHHNIAGSLAEHWPGLPHYPTIRVECGCGVFRHTFQGNNAEIYRK